MHVNNLHLDGSSLTEGEQLVRSFEEITELSCQLGGMWLSDVMLRAVADYKQALDEQKLEFGKY